MNKNKQFNKYITTGLLINGVFLFTNGTSIEIPEIIKGFCCGLGCTLILFGAYANNHDISKFKNFKRKIIGKFIC